ncbi:MAG: hypothetical protein ACI3X4_02355 [Bacteroidaceae bacterium]
MNNYSKSYHLPEENREEKHHSKPVASGTDKRKKVPVTPTSASDISGKAKAKFWVAWVAAFLFVSLGWQFLTRPHDKSQVTAPADTGITNEEEPAPELWEEEEESLKLPEDKDEEEDSEPLENENEDEDEEPPVSTAEPPISPKTATPTHQQPEQERQDVREESLLEALERANHADVVKQAKRAGVSTEGSTMEILERINHADVVKQARHAGVSTEGSTMEILERINHADVVKQAKRAGVSTEGSTMEILERINKKELERYR